MKRYKSTVAIALALLAVVSFFVPHVSYHPSFFITSNRLVVERPINTFWECGGLWEVCFLAVFTPALVCATLQTRFERNMMALTILSLISSVFMFGVVVMLSFELFATQVKHLSGFYLFVGLSILGCMGFWILAFREIWHRVRSWFPKFGISAV